MSKSTRLTSSATIHRLPSLMFCCGHDATGDMASFRGRFHQEELEQAVRKVTCALCRRAQGNGNGAGHL